MCVYKTSCLYLKLELAAVREYNSIQAQNQIILPPKLPATEGQERGVQVLLITMIKAIIIRIV